MQERPHGRHLYVKYTIIHQLQLALPNRTSSNSIPTSNALPLHRCHIKTPESTCLEGEEANHILPIPRKTATFSSKPATSKGTAAIAETFVCWQAQCILWTKPQKAKTLCICLLTSIAHPHVKKHSHLAQGIIWLLTLNQTQPQAKGQV
jgi:hypothetical protein